MDKKSKKIVTLSDVQPRKIEKHGEITLILGRLVYKYINTAILKSGDHNEYYRCSVCPGRLIYTVNKDRISPTTAHTTKDCRVKFHEWQRNLEELHNRSSRKLKAIVEEEDETELDSSSMAEDSVTVTLDETMMNTGSEEETTMCSESSSESFNDETTVLVTENGSILDGTDAAIANLNWTEIVSPVRSHRHPTYMPTPNAKTRRPLENQQTKVLHSVTGKSTKNYFDETPPIKQVKFADAEKSFVSRNLPSN